jgi:hypothetical protein
MPDRHASQGGRLGCDEDPAPYPHRSRRQRELEGNLGKLLSRDRRTFYSLFMVLNAAYPRNTFKNLACVVFYALSFIGWIGCFAASGKYTGLVGWGWALYFAAAITLAAIRSGFRGRYNIRSTVVGDFLGSLFFWPQVLAQLRIQCLELGLPMDKDDDEEDKEAPEAEELVPMATVPEMADPTDPVK